MNKDAAARIVDGKTLCYNSALPVELAVLAKGLEEGRKVIKRFARERGAEDCFAPHLGALRLVPSELERYAQALDIVKAIGRAAGEEVYRIDYDGEYEPFFQYFREGLVSGEDPEGTTDGTLGGLFLDCGRTAGGIMACVLPDDAEARMEREGFAMFLENAFDAFADGVMEKLE
jgi:hypothetical protein